jgi:hypothetical protein
MNWIRGTGVILLSIGMALPLMAQEAPPDGPPEPPGWGGPPDEPADRGGPPELGRGGPPEADRGGPPEADRGGPGRGGAGGEPAAGGPTMEIRRALGISDDEWQVLLPKILAVQAAQKDVEHSARGGRGPARGGPDRGGPDRGEAIQTVSTPLQVAQTALQSVLTHQQSATVAEYQSAMAAMRAARKKSAAALLKAQNELIPFLTVRQEAILMQFGIL